MNCHQLVQLKWSGERQNYVHDIITCIENGPLINLPNTF